MIKQWNSVLVMLLKVHCISKERNLGFSMIKPMCGHEREREREREERDWEGQKKEKRMKTEERKKYWKRKIGLGSVQNFPKSPNVTGGHR